MKHAPRKRPLSEPAESFRLPMPVTKVYLFRDQTLYPLCPRCHITLDREFQAYCDRCGQALSWSSYKHARVIRIS